MQVADKTWQLLKVLLRLTGDLYNARRSLSLSCLKSNVIVTRSPPSVGCQIDMLCENKRFSTNIIASQQVTDETHNALHILSICSLMLKCAILQNAEWGSLFWR